MRVRGLRGLAAVAVGAAVSWSAQASPVTSLFGYNGTTTQAIDDNVESIIQRDGNFSLDIGDSLRGIFKITLIKSAVTGAGGAAIGATPFEWTGVFQTQVYDKVATGVIDSVTGLPEYNFFFGPDPAFAEAIGLGNAALLPGDAGAMVVFYEHAPADFTSNSGLLATDEANATDGLYFWSLGYTAPVGTELVGGSVTDRATAVGEAWIAENTIDTVPAVTGTTIAGDINFWLNRVYATIGGAGVGEGLDLNGRFSPFPDGPATSLVEFTGTADVQTSDPGLVSPGWQAQSQTRFDFNAVPLPPAVWPGAVMIGLLALRKVRRTAQVV